jgi:hypothetical protein
MLINWGSVVIAVKILHKFCHDYGIVVAGAFTAIIYYQNLHIYIIQFSRPNANVIDAAIAVNAPATTIP